MGERLTGGRRSAAVSKAIVRLSTLSALAAMAVWAGSAGTGHSATRVTARPSPGGVFIATYAPRNVTSKASQLRVRFSTTGRAQSGWEYYVYLQVPGRKPTKGSKARCAWVAASWVPGMVRRVQHISGVSGGNYTIWLRAAKKLGGHFCAGAAVLDIGTAPTGHASERRRLLRRLTLRIAPAG